MIKAKHYIRSHDKLWWLKDKQRFLYMLREISSLFLGLYTIMLIIRLASFTAGESYYDSYLDFMATPSFMIYSIITLIFALIHTITWFFLAPQAMPLVIAGKKMPNGVITGGCFIVFLGLVGIITWFIKELTI